MSEKRWTGDGVAALLRERTALDPDALLSTHQVAERLGVIEVTVRRWIAAGKLPAGNVRTPDRPLYRVRLADLLAFELNSGLTVRALPNLGPDDVA